MCTYNIHKGPSSTLASVIAHTSVIVGCDHFVECKCQDEELTLNLEYYLGASKGFLNRGQCDLCYFIRLY